MDQIYYRPVPGRAGPRLAGGWLRFEAVEALSRSAPPRMMPVADLPAEVLDRLTRPRAPLAGLAMDRPQIMGIVNVTPDSFSDGGAWFDTGRAVDHGRALAQGGAAILDIGGESTRPGAAELPVAEEVARIVPVLRGLGGAAVLSADTRKAAVAEAAVEAGVGMINDVSGLDFDPGLAGVVARTGAALCIMHAQGLPATMQDDPRYDDVLLDVYDALAERVARAEAAGIPRARIAVDPGIGFGKTAAHNLTLLRNISLFHALGCPILLGVSRKRFIAAVAGGDLPAPARDPGTLAVTLAAVAQGVQVHRVHNVADVAQGLALWRALDPE